MKMDTGPTIVSMKDHAKLAGVYAVLYMDDVKIPAKIIRVEENPLRLIYEVLGGLNKGKIFSSRFDDSQSANIYDRDNLNLALLET
jgi:hypothetical protein